MRITNEQWAKVNDDVTSRMLDHTRPLTTPLFYVADDEVEYRGTGSFVEIRDKRIILTCEHVVARQPIAYTFHKYDGVFQHPGPWVSEVHPTDLGFASMSDVDWSAIHHQSMPAQWSRFAQKHQIACKEEMIFFRGYASENATYGFETFVAKATGYCSQEKEGSGDADVFEIFWDPPQASIAKDTSEEAKRTMRFDNPHGFSGSLVWNTRYLEVSRSGRTWSPDDAVVTGVARRWDPKTKTLLVYRVEHVRKWVEPRIDPGG